MDDLTSELLKRWNPEEERCGVVLDTGEVVDVLNYAKKLSAGKSEFAMRNKDVRKAVGDGIIRGVFHTHPSNTARPSEKDIAGWPGVPEYYIVTQNSVTEWKLVGSHPVLVARAGSALDHRVRQATA